MKKLILHIPHSSTRIPIKTGYHLNEVELEKEILKLTDWHTEDLFHSPNDELIIAEFSRIFCDPERFIDDSQEVMAQYGMGVLYEKTDDGRPMREVSSELREEILTNFYWEHHRKLNQAVNEQLAQFGQALIVDCHSYPSKPIKRDLDQTPNRPDFNIGTDAFHTSPKLIEISKEFFERKGYSLGIDWPYSGSLVPLEHYRKNKNVQSIMLEINRGLYLNEPSNQKSTNYDTIKEVTSEFLETLRQCLN